MDEQLIYISKCGNVHLQSCDEGWFLTVEDEIDTIYETNYHPEPQGAIDEAMGGLNL